MACFQKRSTSHFEKHWMMFVWLWIFVLFLMIFDDGASELLLRSNAVIPAFYARLSLDDLRLFGNRGFWKLRWIANPTRDLKRPQKNEFKKTCRCDVLVLGSSIKCRRNPPRHETRHCRLPVSQWFSLSNVFRWPDIRETTIQKNLARNTNTSRSVSFRFPEFEGRHPISHFCTGHWAETYTRTHAQDTCILLSHSDGEQDRESDQNRLWCMHFR